MENITMILHLNARLQPIHRGEIYEDPINEVLHAYKIGEVTGGGTLQESSGEIRSCDVEISIKSESKDSFIIFLKEVPMPKGSYLETADKKVEFGELEGLGLYLNGTELAPEVYESCDVNYLIGELDKLLKDCGERYSHWEGSSETALYYYGKSFDEMKAKIEEFIRNYPLCEKCRVVQIA